MVKWWKLKGRQKTLTKKGINSLEKFKLYFEDMPHKTYKKATRRKRNEGNISR